MSELSKKNELFQEMSNNEVLELNGGWSDLVNKYVTSEIIRVTRILVNRGVNATVQHYERVGKKIKNGEMQPCPYQC